MKKFTLIISAVIALISIISWNSFKKTSDNSSNNSILQKQYFETSSNMLYDLNDQNELKKIIKKFANEKKEIEWIEEPSFKDFEDKKGHFKAVYAMYKIGNEVTRFVLPLESKINSKELKENNESIYIANGCSMKCTSSLNCSNCHQQIIERCAEQLCSFNSENRGGSSIITFLDHVD